MSFTLDFRDEENNISINTPVPDGFDDTILLDFISEYDQQVYLRTLDVKRTGDWLVAHIPNDRIPDTDTYTVKIYSSQTSMLTLKDIQTPLKDIMVPLRYLVGSTRREILKTLQATVIGPDYETQNVPDQDIQTVQEYIGPTELVFERVSNNENTKGTTYR